MGAQAAVDAAAEGQMPVDLAIERTSPESGRLGLVEFADPISTMTCSPLLMGQPLSSVSCAAIRGTAMTGVSHRSNSSTARGTRPGSATKRRRCPGSSAR